MNESTSLDLLISLIAALEDHKSWAGETHIQKCAYFAQEGFGIGLGRQFVLYKHGPYSFDLHDQLGHLIDQGVLQVVARQPPYGPSIRISSRHHPVVASAHDRTGADKWANIEHVAKQFGTLGVAELERLSTALFARRVCKNADEDELTDWILSRKSHLHQSEVLEAIRQTKNLLDT